MRLIPRQAEPSPAVFSEQREFSASAVPQGRLADLHGLTVKVALATTFVLPDEEGPGARLEARSGSLRPHSARRRCSRPLRLCPDPLAAVCSGTLYNAGG